jgi:hypothetical protein
LCLYEKVLAWKNSFKLRTPAGLPSKGRAGRGKQKPLGWEEIPFELKNDKVILRTGGLCVINLTCLYLALNPGTPRDSQLDASG